MKKPSGKVISSFVHESTGLKSFPGWHSRLGAEEAKRRESLRQLESEAQAEGKGLWASTGEEVLSAS